MKTSGASPSIPIRDVDVVPSRLAILLLGSLFAEGQRAEPCFRQLAAQADSLPCRLINGGLLATGFRQNCPPAGLATTRR